MVIVARNFCRLQPGRSRAEVVEREGGVGSGRNSGALSPVERLGVNLGNVGGQGEEAVLDPAWPQSAGPGHGGGAGGGLHLRRRHAAGSHGLHH